MRIDGCTEKRYYPSEICYSVLEGQDTKDEQKRPVTMHINRKPGEQVEVDWAGDPAHIIMGIDPD